MVNIKLIFSLSKLVNNNKSITVEKGKLGDAIRNIRDDYPKVSELTDDNGRLLPNINIILNDKLISEQDLSLIQLESNDEVVFIPTIVGG